jgi:hypothetical protein
VGKREIRRRIMAGISIFDCSLENIEEHANFGRALTIKYLCDEGLLPVERGNEVLRTFFITARKPGWFARVLRQDLIGEKGVEFAGCVLKAQGDQRSA